MVQEHQSFQCVAPFTGAWIETSCLIKDVIIYWSLLSQERGLKPNQLLTISNATDVAPFTGAWIETGTCSCNETDGLVAPFTGAWIETSSFTFADCSDFVAPFTGAWIETYVRFTGG